MNSALQSDIDTFFSEFGEPATYSHAGANPADITVIHDDAAVNVELYGSIDSTSPRVYVKDAETTGVDYGDVLVVRSKPFTVAGIKPDGTGITMLTLERP